MSSVKKHIITRIQMLTEEYSNQEMQCIKKFLFAYGKPEKIELLPYHIMGENKYAAIGRDVQRFIPPDNNKLKELKDIF